MYAEKDCVGRKITSRYFKLDEKRVAVSVEAKEEVLSERCRDSYHKGPFTSLMPQTSANRSMDGAASASPAEATYIRARYAFHQSCIQRMTFFR